MRVRFIAVLLGFWGATMIARGAVPPLRVVSLHTVLTELAVEVGGPDVAVVGLIKPGIDPHTFDPSPADARDIASADLVLAGGLGLENYLDRLARNAGGRAKFVRVGDRLPGRLTDAAGEPDPHWWNGIDEVRAAAAVVRAEFAGLRPRHAADFAVREELLQARLRHLQEWARAEVTQLPPARRELVTSHDAFAYFARDYGFVIHPLMGANPEAEPDARQLAAVIDLIRERRIKAVFVEASLNQDLIEMIVRETGCSLGGTLYADGLGLGPASTYDGAFRHNLTTLVEALR
jgi:zinc/manganese transport system substrate-binding protein